MNITIPEKRSNHHYCLTIVHLVKCDSLDMEIMGSNLLERFSCVTCLINQIKFHYQLESNICYQKKSVAEIIKTNTGGL